MFLRQAITISHHLKPSLSPKAFQRVSRCLLSTEQDRESMPFDVLIVGGGPAGLAASIRLRQLCESTGKDLSVCVIDKGSEIGSHILSGNVFDPKALVELLPDTNWVEELYASTGSVATPVSEDKFLVLGEGGSNFTVPQFLMPPQIHNEGNYVVSLSQMCRWLAVKAEEMGVEIYPGFAASEVLLENGSVQGVATRDVGLAKDGSPKGTFERGVELRARQTLFAEGARGSCAEWLIEHFDLRKGGSVSPQTYGLGIKEVWQVAPEQLIPGFVQHTLGYPLQSGFFDKTFGGSFLYHQEPDLVLVGMVVGLDYRNPYLSPYNEFQRWKTHPAISQHLRNGKCISYGARVLNEGGYHSIPELAFPGGALLGCAAGFVNVAKIKGSHTAIKSGMLAADHVHRELTSDGSLAVLDTCQIDPTQSGRELKGLTDAVKNSWIGEELFEVRNTHEAFSRWGILPGMIHTGLSSFVTKGMEPWTLKHSSRDSEATAPAAEFDPIAYDPPDNKLTFDLLTNLQRSGVFHEDDQPSHLKLRENMANIPEQVSFPIYNAPESRFCPAGVYEYVDSDDSGLASKKLVINAQNCVHCKCCSIKMPREYIQWTVPEGGGGPQYQVM